MILPKKQPPFVSLLPAFEFQCVDCGRTNYCSSVPYEFENDEQREEAFRMFHQLEDWESLPPGIEDFGGYMMPRRVRCGHCDLLMEVENNG